MNIYLLILHLIYIIFFSTSKYKKIIRRNILFFSIYGNFMTCNLFMPRFAKILLNNNIIMNSKKKLINDF